jgi:hypothetical protein
MKDPLCRRFFLEPQQTLHRRYKALRAVFVDRQPQTQVAKRFGYTYNTLRRLVSDFRAQCQGGQISPFSAPHPASDRLATVVAAHRPVPTLPSLPTGGSCLSPQGAACGPG